MLNVWVNVVNCMHKCVNHYTCLMMIWRQNDLTWLRVVCVYIIDVVFLLWNARLITWFIVYTCLRLMRWVVRVRTTDDALNVGLYLLLCGCCCMIDYGQCGADCYVILYEWLQSEWGCIYYYVIVIALLYDMHHMLLLLWKRRVISSEWGLVTYLKLRTGAWSSKWGLRVQSGDSVHLKNQILSWYCMHIGLSCESISEGALWRA